MKAFCGSSPLGGKITLAVCSESVLFLNLNFGKTIFKNYLPLVCVCKGTNLASNSTSTSVGLR